MAHLAPGRAASRPVCRTIGPVSHGVPRPISSPANTTTHRRSIIRASSNGATAPTDWDAVYAGKALPGQYAGPIEVQPTEGKGRGLVATRDVSAGELLLVDAPLLYMTADSEVTPPTVQQLKEKLDAGRFTAHELAWLRALTTGEGLAEPGPAPALGQGPTSADTGDLQAISGLDDARKTKVLELNRFSGPCPDLAVSVIRGEEPVPFMGLWPQFALFNHSCAPNAEWLTLHDRLVVRASKDVSKGAELTVSYLGPQTLRPAAERLMDLREDRDMACACPRCAVEMDDEYGPLIAAVHQADALVTTDIVPNLQASLAEGGLGNPRALEVVEGALDRLQPVLASLEQQLGSSAGGNGGGPLAPELAGWMRASAYQAYSVQAQLLDLLLEIKAGGPEEAAAAAKLMAYESFVMAVAAAVLPASDAQLLQAVKVWARAQQAYGAEGAEVHQAEARAMQVLRLRYGPGLKEETVARLVQATAASLLSE